MPSIPIVFHQTDAPAFLPPPGHALSRVRRYRTQNFVFSLAADERVLLHERASLEPVVARCAAPDRPACSGAAALLTGAALLTHPAHPGLVALLGATVALAAWAAARPIGLARARRRLGANDPETFVVTHHRVLRFTPTGWHRVWNEKPLTESPYDVVEIPLEAVADARAVEIPGLDGSGAVEVRTFCGERELFLHVPDAPAMAARIQELAMAFGERRARPSGRAPLGARYAER